MAKLKIKGRELRKLGLSSGKQAALALNILRTNFKYLGKEELIILLLKYINNPTVYLDDPVWGPLAKELVHAQLLKEQTEELLLQEPLPYHKFGQQHIEKGAIQQMEIAMRLPIVAEGALMPDAHQGYGLPIGGVLATENAVIPYAVGMDIGCRMCLSVFDIPTASLETQKSKYKGFLHENSRFGREVFNDPMDDEVLEMPYFNEIPVLKRLKQKARNQIGSSGSGNHFVEFGRVEIKEFDPHLQLQSGEYIGLLTHSGSRGLGANIAQHFTKLAMASCHLPKEAQALAWLDLNSETGEEYWLAMNLAGDYASACHQHIHQRMTKALGEKPIAVVENHHNFAWKEELADGREVVVHRKGATPAGKDVLGVIPGSMTAPGFIVKGRGLNASLSSASHGAGRAMSRRKAKASFTKKEVKSILKKHQVELIGGGIDEAPMAYKDIHEVMKSQRDLVDVIGAFYPKIVRMDNA